MVRISRGGRYRPVVTRSRISSYVRYLVVRLHQCLIIVLTFIAIAILLLYRHGSRHDNNTVSVLGSSNTELDAVVLVHNERQFLKFDEAGMTPILSRTNILADAVPLRRRIPMEHYQDIEYHLRKKIDTETPSILGEKRKRRPFYDNQDKYAGVYNWDHDFRRDNRALYLQNPSILPLHNTILTDSNGNGNHDNEPDNLSPKDLQMLTGGDPSVRYLGFFSANIGGKCFGPQNDKLYKTGETVAYYAVALLDENLRDITSVLIDINAGPVSGNYKYWRQFTGDCRLVLIKGWIYGVCTQYILKFKIRRRTNNAHAHVQTAQEEEEEEHLKEYTGKNLSYPYKYPNIYGDGLDVILYSNQRIKGHSGKNFNVFRSQSQLQSQKQSSSRTNTDTNTNMNMQHYLQIWPSPHEYAPLIIPNGILDHVQLLLPTQQSTLPPPRPSFDGPDTPHKIITCPENEDGGKNAWVTNCTDATTSEFFSDKDHGTSCCIQLELPLEEQEEEKDGGRTTIRRRNVVVNVGISHQKTTLLTNPWWRRDIRSIYNDRISQAQYVSRFVAYDTQPPFDILARSGWFCLGFDANNANANASAKNTTTRAQKLDLFGEYDCPAIHFPSTFAEVVGNPDRAIIGYGINDCTHNLIVVEKEEIRKRLLRGK
mmetsp:Transcript_9659/g.14902  ORF Transcript_9659/g.14902 Transcript_9659/m.14902 type:complete len:653 (-) Transcript_9659:176-2134(-)|eukprot:CAMPEP_0194254780 /NCGR_PEP_ID=MMETSP0158-20130606/32861_1 /TAXON_ID=33649 /ORGANISM="Thalassionema nitzschioides, Strain L26-B" /LENGTH=652 /DNA_ID=CAMNT_0038992935 /DNA_START=81 /DNA_END=2039 /DNA_ORIENTATION=+